MNLPGLTGLRWLAAFYVFIYHIHLRTPFTFLPWPLKNIIALGPLGVNIFFALSGFLLTFGYYQKEIKLADFFFKRFARIYPVYFVGLLLYLAVSYSMNLPPNEFIILVDGLMIQSFIPPWSMQWYGGGGAWSVSTEVGLYLLFPLLLPLLTSMKEKGLWIILVFILILSSGFGYMTQYHGMNYLFTYTFPLARFPEFLSGMVAALLTFKYNFRINYWLGLGIVFLSCLYIVYFSPSLNGFAIHNIFILPGVLAFMNLLLNYFKWVGSPIMVYLGKISYGFYILQIPLTYIMYTLLQNKVILPTDFYAGLLLFAANLSLAILIFEYIEKPVHLSLQRRFTQFRLSLKN